MAADALANIVAKRDALKEADANADVGVRKKAVAAKKADDAAPAVKDDKPNKYNTPRNPGESMDAYAVRLKSLRDAASGK